MDPISHDNDSSCLGAIYLKYINYMTFNLASPCLSVQRIYKLKSMSSPSTDGCFFLLLKIKIFCAILRISLVKDFEHSEKSIHLRHLASQEGQVKVARDISPTHQSVNIIYLSNKGNNIEYK